MSIVRETLGDVVADQMEAAMARTLDAAVFHGTQPIQENDMNAEQITEVSATVDAGLTQADLDGMNEAERLALVVGAAYGKALAERDEARDVAAYAIARLATARDLLNKVVPILDDSTWATDSALAGSIQAFLDTLQDVDSPQAPTQED